MELGSGTMNPSQELRGLNRCARVDILRSRVHVKNPIIRILQTVTTKDSTNLTLIAVTNHIGNE